MNSLKSPLIAAAAVVFLFVALVLIAVLDAEKQNAQDTQEVQQSYVVSDTILPQAKLPVLNIDGNEKK